MPTDTCLADERRRRSNLLDDVTIDHIAERAAEKAVAKIEEDLYKKVVEQLEERFYSEVGKTFVTKILKAVGVALVALTVYLTNNGYFKV